MDAETRKFLEKFRAEMHSRFDEAERERSLMWNAIMRLSIGEPLAETNLSLSEAVERRKGNGRAE